VAKEVSAEKTVREIRRKTRRRFSAEEKIRIVLEGLRGEESIAALCRREGIAANLYYRWSKEFLEAGKKRLLGDTKREATSSEVGDLRKENARLKELVAETIFENRLLKKSVTGYDADDAKEARAVSWLTIIRARTSRREPLLLNRLHSSPERQSRAARSAISRKSLRKTKPWMG
jgi:transposase